MPDQREKGAPDRAPLVFVLGDSISMQYGPFLGRMIDPEFRYARKSSTHPTDADLDRPRANGANGGDSSMVLEYLTSSEALRALLPQIMLLNCGLHDIKTHPATGAVQVSLDAYRENLSHAIAVAQTIAPTVVWVRTTPVDDDVHNARQPAFSRYQADVERYNDAADAVVREAGLASIDLHGFTLALGDDLYCDHVHFHERIRVAQAAFIAGWLRGRFM